MQITLKAARVNAGFNQSEVAKRLQRTKETISNWENGKVCIRVSDFKKLCSLYNVAESDIFLPPKFT